MVLAVSACTPDENIRFTGQTDGFSPVYALPSEITKIDFEPARKTEIAGKIYAIGNYIFQSEVNKGIHIINNQNRDQPKKVGFLKVPYSTEIAVKGKYLYTNNLSDLVVFDISDLNVPRMVKRVKDVFPPIGQQYPPFQNIMFECPDPAKGIIVHWERKMINNPKCRR